MKQLKFNLDNLFRLSTISAVQTFELENNSSELIISTDVKPELAYELHIESPEGKSFVILEKADGAVKCLLNSGMLKLGVNKLQLRGVGANDYSIESNRVEFTVKSFINASVEPEPSEQTAFEKLVVEVNVLKNDVDNLSDKIDSAESAVAALGTNLELEKVNRANSDLLLNSKIDAEHEAREMEDSSIKSSIQTLEEAKQDKLVPGNNITIEGNVISAIVGGDVTKEYVDQQDEAIKKMIPSKTSDLENDSDFVTRQELNEKMEFYKLDYIGGALSHEGVVLNYQQIVDKFNDDQYFVYATDGSFVFIPCLPPLPGDEILEFSSTYIYGGKNYMARIIINSENQVKWEEIEVARATDLDSLEKISNKVSEITDENKDSEDNYPSNKAVTEYMDSQRTYREVILYDNPSGIEFYPQSPKTLTLPQSIKDFDAICFTAAFSDATDYRNTTVIPTSSIVVDGTIMTNTYCIGNRYESPSVKFTADNTVVLQGYSSSEHMIMYRIVGIKYASSVKFEAPVDDIQINGTSIVSDGVANIPLTKQNQLGVSYVQANRGVSILGDGGLFINKASHGIIDGRLSAYLPIVADETLDYAVKQAMCDGKGAEWTDAEKASARARMGVGDFVLLNDITVSSDTNLLELSTDSANSPYKLKGIIIVLDMAQGSASSSGTIKLRKINAYVNQIAHFNFSVLTSGYSRVSAIVKSECKNNTVWYSEGVASPFNATSSSITVSQNGDSLLTFCDNNHDYIGFVSIAGNIIAGTKIKIYGVRA